MTASPSAADLIKELDAAQGVAAARLEEVSDLDGLRSLEAEITGKRSALAAVQARLGALPPDDRKEAGRAVQEARGRLADLVDAARRRLGEAGRQARLEGDRLDLTEIVAMAESANLGVPDRGHLNLVTQTRDELEDVFVSLGFAVAEGPEAETDWYNFEALNMPPAHPARSMWDTLYLKLGAPESVLLRTHTSPTQIRVMTSQKPPIYAVMPGRCYRRDTPDARHLPVFHQIEGLVVDRGITFGDLAGTIEAFTTAYFGPEIHSRLRPSFFPFTEPSAEYEVTCPICVGQGCRTCSHTGWIELGGCGMVDPNVFNAVGIDPEEYTGFAFGFGIDRCAQVRHVVEDMRVLLENDVRFLKQF